VIRVTDTLSIDEWELDERFVRASGPGGQHVNKVATAVELRFDITSSSLPGDVKERLRALAPNRITDDGVLILDSRQHRTQARNRDAARERLVNLLRLAARPPRRRRPTRPTRAAREQRLESKKRRSALKSRRRRGSTDD
jgi:ribosome-associated protein